MRNAKRERTFRVPPPLRTTGTTLLAASVFLLAALLLFGGAMSLLAGRNGGTVSYAMSISVPAEEELPVLYPWHAMTVSLETETLDEAELNELLVGFLPSEPDGFYAVHGQGGEFLMSEDKSLLGFRDMTVTVLQYQDLYEVDPAENVQATLLSSTRYLLSFAVREDPYGQRELCCLSFRPEQGADASPDAAATGTDALWKYAQAQTLQPDGQNPFTTFLWQYASACERVGADYANAFDLFLNGSVSCRAVGNDAYFTFSFKSSEMTLLCDLTTLTVFGISLQTDQTF